MKRLKNIGAGVNNVGLRNGDIEGDLANKVDEDRTDGLRLQRADLEKSKPRCTKSGWLRTGVDVDTAQTTMYNTDDQSLFGRQMTRLRMSAHRMRSIRRMQWILSDFQTTR